MRIKISQIKVTKRIRVDNGDIEELSRSIKKEGILVPIIVRKLEDDQYKLLAGNRRLKACKKLQETHIEARVVKTQ